MKFDEILPYRTCSYTKTCSCCDLKHQILTQHDDCPEYYTDIYLQCQCGEYVEFELPVN